MKKTLQKVLVLALGLTTTIASAQWSASSTTRIDNTDSDARTAANRIALAADLGAVHVSYDINYAANLGTSTLALDNVYEAYASTDLMGFGTLTIGRKDLSFGSGALISSNDWGLDRYTQDGISLSANLGGFDINLGSLGGVQYDATNYMNASGNFGGADVNILMMNSGDDKAHGYDLSYDMNNFSVSASMNSDFDGNELTNYGLTYNVTDDLSASFSRSSGGDSTGGSGNFTMANTASGADHWNNGNMGHVGANEEGTTMGISYDLGDITLSYSMTTVTDDDDLTDDREVTIMSLSYQLNDNCNISMSRFSDTDEETTLGWDAGERTYLSIAIGL
jgi:hypothetical protein